MKTFDDLASRRRVAGRRRTTAGRRGHTWEDILGDYAGVDAGRYTNLSQIDRWRALPFDMPPPPERGAVMLRVRQLIHGLNGAIDEGTGSVLDRTIEAWVGRWIATVQTEYVDHCALIDLFRCQAAEWVRETTVRLEYARTELDQVNQDYQIVAGRLRRDALAELAAELKPETERADGETEIEAKGQIKTESGTETDGDPE
jgi:hypothetical protein